MGLLALFDGKYDKVVYIYPNEWLQNRDETDFQGLWDVADLSNKVEYKSSLKDLLPQNKLLYIIDEIDYFIFDDPETFFKLTRNTHVIGLTATWTSSEGDNNGENEFLSLYGFKEIQATSFVSREHIKPQDAMQLVRSELSLDPEQIHTWLKEELKKRAVLIWTTPELKNELKIRAEVLPFLDGDVPPSASVLRKLHEKSKDKLFPVVVASDKRTMRGTDYRAPNTGISLLICRSFSSQRELDQAKLRVGRQEDPCMRMIAQGVERINVIEEQAHKKKLLKAARNFKKLEHEHAETHLGKRPADPKSMSSVNTQVEIKRQNTGKFE